MTRTKAEKDFEIRFFLTTTTRTEEEEEFLCKLLKIGKNEIKKQVNYLYVCYWPGLEDCSSRPGIVSRSLSRGGFLSLSFKHGFFFT